MESLWKMRPDALKDREPGSRPDSKASNCPPSCRSPLEQSKCQLNQARLSSGGKRQSPWIAQKHHKKGGGWNSDLFRSDRLDRRSGGGRRDVQRIANSLTTIIHRRLSGIPCREASLRLEPPHRRLLSGEEREQGFSVAFQGTVTVTSFDGALSTPLLSTLLTS